MAKGTCRRHSVSTTQWPSENDSPTDPIGLNYLVQIDNDGKLRWAKTGDLVDTTTGHFKDAGKGRGIIPIEIVSRPTSQHRTSFEAGAPSSSSSAASEADDAQMHYYLGPHPIQLLQKQPTGLSRGIYAHQPNYSPASRRQE